MENDKVKNGLYIGFTILVVLIMSGMTWSYLSNRHEIKGDTPAVHKTTKEDVDTNDSKSSETKVDDDSKKEDAVSPSETEASSTSDLLVTDSSVVERVQSEMKTESDDATYVSNYRFLYTAAGGDTLQTISELTGVEVSVIAKANYLSEDVVLSVGQEVYVP